MLREVTSSVKIPSERKNQLLSVLLQYTESFSESDEEGGGGGRIE